MSATVLFVVALVGILALSSRKDVSHLVAVSTIGFQIIAVSYVAAFFAPAFVTSLKKLSLGIRLSYKGIELASDTMRRVEDLRDELAPLIEKSEALVDRISRAVDDENGVLAKAAQDLERIRRRIERETDPVAVRRREG